MKYDQIRLIAPLHSAIQKSHYQISLLTGWHIRSRTNSFIKTNSISANIFLIYK